jgi:hypothetical protein
LSIERNCDTDIARDKIDLAENAASRPWNVFVTPWGYAAL